MTPERELYERQKALTERSLQAGRREANNLILGAEGWGIVITIEESPLWPPSMGNTEVVAKVRISRERQNELEALRLAAVASEAP